MTTNLKKIPPGPTEKYHTSQDLLSWMVANLRQFGSIYKASIYGSDVYVVSDPKYAHHILRENWQNYKKGQTIKRVGLLLGNGLMVSEGEFWKSQRRMIQPAFHQEALGALTNMIVEANVKLLDKWLSAAQEGIKVNITRDIHLMVLDVVLISLFGDDYDAVAPHFSILSHEQARNLQFAQAFRPLGNIVSQVITERRANNAVRTDILGMLMEARDHESGRAMPDRQVVSEIMTLIVAGHETTASTLNWVWYLLSQHPETEQKLSEELSTLDPGGFGLGNLQKFIYTHQVIEEAMRLYPAGWLMTRRALKDDQLGEYFIPAGTEIYISPYLMQRHLALWDDPDRFDPDRFEPNRVRERHPLVMLPFSAGPRKCVGELFARIEMQIHLIIIARQIRFRFAGEDQVEIETGVNLRSKSDFLMVPEIRVPAFHSS